MAKGPGKEGLSSNGEGGVWRDKWSVRLYGEVPRKDVRAKLREWIANRLSLRPEQCEVVEGQVMRLGMLSTVLKELQDPDWRFVEEIGSGVKLGVDVELPRTPSVFEEKVRWNLDGPDYKMANVSENCGAVEENMTEVRKLFEKERSLGWMVEMSDKEAQEANGEKLHIASLAVVTEKDKIGKSTTRRTKWTIGYE